jgi:hypothetical protein
MRQRETSTPPPCFVPDKKKREKNDEGDAGGEIGVTLEKDRKKCT